MSDDFKFTPNFLVTVPRSLYEAVCDGVGQPFADSYLTGAVLHEGKLWPRTLTGWQKMRDVGNFMRLLSELEIKLMKPEPYPGNGDRLTIEQMRKRG